MHQLTLVSLTALLFSPLVTAQAYTTTGCATITTTKPPAECATPLTDCITLACLARVSITQSCGCGSIPTTSTCPTACPTGCGATQYITAIQDCFPTATGTGGGGGYQNTTKTITSTTTLTTCPPSKTCTGQTVTYTSTEVCPSATCVCVYPTVTYETTFLPGQTHPATETTVVHPTGTGTNMPTGPTASQSIIEANVAAGREWGWSGGLLGALVGFGVFLGV